MANLPMAVTPHLLLNQRMKQNLSTLLYNSTTTLILPPILTKSTNTPMLKMTTRLIPSMLKSTGTCNRQVTNTWNPSMESIHKYIGLWDLMVRNFLYLQLKIACNFKSSSEKSTLSLFFCQSSDIWKNSITRYLKSVHFKNTVARSSVLSKLRSFSKIHQPKSKQSHINENDQNFESTEDRATLSLK